EAGQQVTGVRVVLGYSSLKLRGDLKVIGPEAAAGIRFRVTARRPDLQMQYLLNAMVDARGQFVFENMSPGEYEIRVYPDYASNSVPLDEQILRTIYRVKERVVVAGDNPQP